MTAKHPLIHLRVVAKPNIWVPAVLISIYGFGVTATAFVLPDYLTRVQGLRDLQIGDVLNWIALPQFVSCRWPPFCCAALTRACWWRSALR